MELIKDVPEKLIRKILVDVYSNRHKPVLGIKDIRLERQDNSWTKDTVTVLGHELPALHAIKLNMTEWCCRFREIEGSGGYLSINKELEKAKDPKEIQDLLQRTIFYVVEAPYLYDSPPSEPVIGALSEFRRRSYVGDTMLKVDNWDSFAKALKEKLDIDINLYYFHWDPPLYVKGRVFDTILPMYDGLWKNIVFSYNEHVYILDIYGLNKYDWPCCFDDDDPTDLLKYFDYFEIPGDLPIEDEEDIRFLINSAFDGQLDEAIAILQQRNSGLQI